MLLKSLHDNASLLLSYEGTYVQICEGVKHLINWIYCVHRTAWPYNINMDQLKNLTQCTCIYLIANKLWIPVLNHIHNWQLDPFQALFILGHDLPFNWSEKLDWGARGITVGQCRVSHLINLVNGQSKVHCSWIFAS